MILARPNFDLQEQGWGECRIIDLGMVLNSVISEFYPNLDAALIPNKPVIVAPSPFDLPDILRQPQFDIIRLQSRDRFWAKHAYQFSHELCHHVVDSNFFGGMDKFGWLEETLCELTSIWCIERMAATWAVNPPWLNWREYSAALTQYVENIRNDPATVTAVDFKNWLRNQIGQLYADRVRRTDNRIIALRLLPIFNNNPSLWQSIQYIRQIDVTAEMSIGEFLIAWREQISVVIREPFDLIVNELSILPKKK